jgi:hypothetical protein
MSPAIVHTKLIIAPIKIIHHNNAPSLVRDTWVLIKVFFNPIIIWAGLMLASTTNLVPFFKMTESPVTAAPPYLFTPDQVGYTNFACAVGALS